MTVTVRTSYDSGPHWHGNGKRAAEIADEIEYTRARIDSDLRTLKARLSVPIRMAAVALALAATLLTYLVRRGYRRR